MTAAAAPLSPLRPHIMPPLCTAVAGRGACEAISQFVFGQPSACSSNRQNSFVSASPVSPRPRSPSGLAVGRPFPSLQMSECCTKKKIGKAADVCLLPIISRFGHFPAQSGGNLCEQHHIRAGLCRTAARGEERGMRGAEICWAGRMRSQQNQAVLMARNQTSLCTLTFIVWGRRESCH